ncbi:hypothetical protein [Acinetobacter guillouiae]|uniref:DUF4347 domain-containing protein n=1 Tax=Acinetobacter guillouiae NIPH 991 TaxID=1217656 RepID=N8YEK6_ACIGI|nr:hypothetical protein [Acinetobacter guillouiae]ENV18038.1 hypothetical protein F964_01357 [Acinetobacter guillouiae NIPH 991]MBP2546058.1 hypothetical protein [Acinetobacter guillouiae]
MSQGTCTTNQKNNSIHEQKVGLKEYLISIYYQSPKKDDDKAFKRASNHCLSKLKLNNCGENFIFKEYQITTGPDFKKIWTEIFSELNKSVAKVKEMHIFSHSSKTDGGNDGLEFISVVDSDKNVIEDGTISFGEISQLEKLRWSPNADLILHGCNTGVRGVHPQAIADVFAIRQEKCRVHGQTGWGYFSKTEGFYTKATPNDKELYLWAYSRGRNNYLGNLETANKMPALIVEKRK